MKRIFGKRSIAVLTAFVTMLSLISLPTATALAAPGEAKLSSLKIMSGDTEFPGSFSEDGLTYTVNVENSVDTVDISAIAEDAGEGATVGGTGTFSINVGENDYDVTCTLGETSNIYHVKVIRADAPPELSVVNIAAIPGVTAPVKGATPVTEITSTPQYTGTVSWNPAADTFAAGTAYTATITLTQEEGYTLTGVTENFFTVEGADPVSNAADSGVITAVFPATSLGIGDTYINNGIKYKVLTQSGTTGTAEVIANSYSGAITIPGTVDNSGITYTVTSIGYEAFYECYGLTSVSLPDSLITIGDYAFYFCNSLTSISVPGGVISIGREAFYHCDKLTSFNIPDGVTSIEDFTFAACNSLTSISIPDGVESIGFCAFVNCLGLTNVIIPGSVTSIEGGAFSNCISLKSIVFLGSTPPSFISCFTNVPAGLKVIVPDGAVSAYETALAGMLPANTQIVEAGPDCSLSTLAVMEFSEYGEGTPLKLSPAFSPNVYEYSLEIHCSAIAVSAYANDPAATVSVKDPDYVFLGSNLFGIDPNDPRVITVEVTNGTASQTYEINVNWPATSGSSLKSLSVSYEKTELPLTPVFDPATLEYSLTVHSWVDSVDIVAEANDEYASIYGDGVNGLEYGENILEVEVDAEDYDYDENSDHCTIYTITITRPTPEEEGSVFSTSDGLVYEDRGTYIAVQGYEGDGEDVTIPAEVTNPNTSETKPVTLIADGAFWMNETITSVAFPSGITKIGDYAFSGCKSLQSVTLPSGLTSLGWNTFTECTSLESVTFPEGLISIGDSTFAGCKNLGNVTLPDSLEELGWCAFNCCASFTSFTLPEKIEDIGEPFLPGCTGLVTISAGTNTRFKVVDGVLLSANGKELIKYPSAMSGTDYDIPAGVESIYEGAFDSCGFESVSIPEGVTELTYYVFESCQNLNSVTFPDNLQSISGCAFDQCTSLTSITLPKGLEDIGGDAFSGCTSLTFIGVDTGNKYFTSSVDGILYDSDKVTLVMFPPGIKGSFTVPNTVSEIGEFAFSSSRLTSINFGTGVTDISYGAFQYCDGLTSVVIPGNVDEIEDEAFFDCSNLSRVTIGSGLSYLGSYSFEGCPRLTAIYFLGNTPYMDGGGDYEDESYPGDRSKMKTSSYDEDQVFPGCSPYLTIYYASGRTGYGRSWNGYPAVKFYPSYKCTVSYNLKGAPGTIPAATVYKYGKAVQPLNPEWEGHKFLGWFKDSACTIPWSFGKYTVTSNVTLYAGWTLPENAYLESLDGFMICDEEYDGDLVFNREFNPSVYSYTATIGEYDDSFSVEPVASYKDAIITIDGVPATFKIYNAENGIPVKSTITVSNGTQTHTYTLTVTRAKSTNNFLSNITYSDGTLASELDTFTQSQTVRLYENTGSVTITPVPEDSHSKVYIGGVAATSRKYSLDNGHSTSVTITVVSQSGKSNYYKVYLTRDKSTNANLKNIKTNYTSIKVTPALSADNKEYTVYLPSSISSVTLYAVKENKDAYTTFKYGAYSWKYSYKTFSVGYGAQKVITIRVTPQDRTYPSKDYTVKIIRAPRMYSFSASPKPGTYAELSPGGNPGESNVMTFKWTQYGPGDVTIDVNDGTDWHQVFTGNNTTHTATWDGSIEGSYLAVETYKARISVTNLGAKSSYKYLYFKIKPAPTVTLTRSLASIAQGGTQRTKITVRWNIVTNIKVEIYDSAGELVATLFNKKNQYANTLYWYWYGKYDIAHGGTVVDPGDYTVKVTAGSVVQTATVTVTPTA